MTAMTQHLGTESFRGTVRPSTQKGAPKKKGGGGRNKVPARAGFKFNIREREKKNWDWEVGCLGMLLNLRMAVLSVLEFKVCAFPSQQFIRSRPSIYM